MPDCFSKAATSLCISSSIIWGLQFLYIVVNICYSFILAILMHLMWCLIVILFLMMLHLFMCLLTIYVSSELLGCACVCVCSCACMRTPTHTFLLLRLSFVMTHVVPFLRIHESFPSVPVPGKIVPLLSPNVLLMFLTLWLLQGCDFPYFFVVFQC